MLDLDRFYAALRPHLNLTQQNVAGCDRVLLYGQARGSRTNDLAYGSATSWWETGQTMWPVREAYWLSEDWRKAHLRYWPFYGRGLVQTTWKDGYRRIAIAMGLPPETFVDNPDLLLEWEHALPALFVGMEQGVYTGKTLADYIDDLDESDTEDFREYVAARRIVNGTDRAEEIARLALVFERGLRAAGYEDQVPSNGGGFPVLYEGTWNNAAVREAQDLLNRAGASPQLSVDGDFGRLTRLAVEAFQGEDFARGAVGRLTWNALRAA